MGNNRNNIIKEITWINSLSNIWYNIIFSPVIDAICIFSNLFPIVAFKGDIVKTAKYKKITTIYPKLIEPIILYNKKASIMSAMHLLIK